MENRTKILVLENNDIDYIYTAAAQQRTKAISVMGQSSCRFGNLSTLYRRRLEQVNRNRSKIITRDYLAF